MIEQTSRRNGENPRVLPFRSRSPDRPHADAPPPVADLGKYERSRSEDRDEYAHRMLVNAIGFVFCGLLILAGIWIANEMANQRRDQDCVLSGRRNCAHIDVPGPLR
jgi:hypothetical protein